MARPWSARCYGVARQREGSRQNSIGGSGVLSLRHFGLVLFIPWGVGAEESGAAKDGFGAATLSGTGSASPRPDRNSWLRGRVNLHYHRYTRARMLMARQWSARCYGV